MLAGENIHVKIFNKDDFYRTFDKDKNAKFNVSLVTFGDPNLIAPYKNKEGVGAIVGYDTIFADKLKNKKFEPRTNVDVITTDKDRLIGYVYRTVYDDKIIFYLNTQYGDLQIPIVDLLKKHYMGDGPLDPDKERKRLVSKLFAKL
jgi:hypothetical protein